MSGTATLKRRNEALRTERQAFLPAFTTPEILLYQSRREEAETELRRINAAAPESPPTPTAQALLDAARLLEQN